MPKAPKTFAMLKDREREARRELILEAAERVYGRKPFETISMRDIAKEAGIAVSSIYRYFPDQQALFVEAFVRGTREILRRVDERAARGEIKSLTDFGLVFVNFLTENDHYFRMMTHFMLDGSLCPEPLKALNQAARQVLDRFERAFGEKGGENVTRLYAHAFFAALNGVLISFRNYPGREPADVRRHMEKLVRTVAQALEGLARNPAQA